MSNNFVHTIRQQPVDQSIMSLDVRRPRSFTWGQIGCSTIAAIAVVVGIWWAGNRIHRSINQTNRRGRLKPKQKSSGEPRHSGSSLDLSSKPPHVQRPISPASTIPSEPVEPAPVAEPIKRSSSPTNVSPSDPSVSNEETRKQMFYEFLQLYANVDSTTPSPEQSNPQSARQSPPSSYKHTPSPSFDQSIAAEPVNHQHHRTMSNQSNGQSPSMDPAALLATSSNEGVAKDLLKQSVGKWEKIDRKQKRKQQLLDDPSTASPASSMHDGFASPLSSLADDLSIGSNDYWEEDDNGLEQPICEEESKQGEDQYDQQIDQTAYFNHPQHSPLQLPAAHYSQDIVTYQSIEQTTTQLTSSPLKLPPRPDSSHSRTNGRSANQPSKQTNGRTRHVRQPSSLSSTMHWHETQVMHIG